MRWYSPDNVLLLLIVAVALLYRHFVQRSREKGGIRFPLTAQIMREQPSRKTRLLWLPEALRLGTLVLLVLSLMRPQYGLEQQQVTRKGLDIMLVLDISGSMAAEDFKPNRLKAA
ncbi:MAG TPA: aerotolerance regulator BatA, partial [Candidatus Ozemobacteraceae bacterium]|nr:aerotolerance regulator BatA [Candidatus Ozemobacteraceae bacterium]